MSANSGKPLKKKIIEVDLTLTDVGATFGNKLSMDNTEGNTRLIRGLACDVNVVKVGLPSRNSAKAQIYNLRQSDIEKITTTSPRRQDVKRNIITIRAYEEGGTPGEVFQGEIFLAYGTYESPDLGVHIEANTGIYPALTVSPPFTYEGKIDGISIIKKYAGEIDYSFESFIQEKMYIRDPVLNGSPLEKIQEIGRILGIQVIVDDRQVKVCRWEQNANRGQVEVSAETGMIGYPSFSSNGINVIHEYHPHFVQGGFINVKTIVPKASGTWKIVKMVHSLQSFGAGPNWRTQLDCIYPESGGVRQNG